MPTYHKQTNNKNVNNSVKISKTSLENIMQKEMYFKKSYKSVQYYVRRDISPKFTVSNRFLSGRMTRIRKLTTLNLLSIQTNSISN